MKKNDTPCDRPAREIRWSKSAVDDLKFWKVTEREWHVIRKEVERIAGVQDIRLDEAVCPVVQCDNVWLRIKISQPRQIRVIFSVSGAPPKVTVQAVLRRTGRTYDLAEIIYKKAGVS